VRVVVDLAIEFRQRSLTELAAQLGVATGTIKTWHHAGLLTDHL
jgi:DNA-directed RNA polymerase specialized sigma24 family protein